MSSSKLITRSKVLNIAWNQYISKMLYWILRFPKYYSKPIHIKDVVLELDFEVSNPRDPKTSLLILPLLIFYCYIQYCWYNALKVSDFGYHRLSDDAASCCKYYFRFCCIQCDRSLKYQYRYMPILLIFYQILPTWYIQYFWYQKPWFNTNIEYVIWNLDFKHLCMGTVAKGSVPCLATIV